MKIGIASCSGRFCDLLFNLRQKRPDFFQKRSGKAVKIGRLSLFFLTFLFVVVACYAQQPAPKEENSASPGKAVDEYAWDFGDVKNGDILKHDFVFKNNTGKPLNIKDVNTSCGCTVSRVDKKALLAGESTNIEVKFNSAKYSGAVTQFVYVNTDNLDNPLVRYTIKANVN